MAGEKEFELAPEIKEQLRKEGDKCATETKENMEKEITIFKEILSIVSKEDCTFAEMVTPLHNLLLILPRERFYFRDRIIKLFELFKGDIASLPTTVYLSERLHTLSKEDTEKEFPCTDYSMYWASYIRILCSEGEVDSRKQIEVQKRMKNKIITVCNEYIIRRKNGINLANRLLNS